MARPEQMRYKPRRATSSTAYDREAARRLALEDSLLTPGEESDLSGLDPELAEQFGLKLLLGRKGSLMKQLAALRGMQFPRTRPGAPAETISDLYVNTKTGRELGRNVNVSEIMRQLLEQQAALEQAKIDRENAYWGAISPTTGPYPRTGPESPEERAAKELTVINRQFGLQRTLAEEQKRYQGEMKTWRSDRPRPTEEQIVQEIDRAFRQQKKGGKALPQSQRDLVTERNQAIESLRQQSEALSPPPNQPLSLTERLGVAGAKPLDMTGLISAMNRRGELPKEYIQTGMFPGLAAAPSASTVREAAPDRSGVDFGQEAPFRFAGLDRATTMMAQALRQAGVQDWALPSMIREWKIVGLDRLPKEITSRFTDEDWKYWVQAEKDRRAMEAEGAQKGGGTVKKAVEWVKGALNAPMTSRQYPVAPMEGPVGSGQLGGGMPPAERTLMEQVKAINDMTGQSGQFSPEGSPEKVASRQMLQRFGLPFAEEPETPLSSSGDFSLVGQPAQRLPEAQPTDQAFWKFPPRRATGLGRPQTFEDVVSRLPRAYQEELWRQLNGE